MVRWGVGWNAVHQPKAQPGGQRENSEQGVRQAVSGLVLGGGTGSV